MNNIVVSKRQSLKLKDGEFTPFKVILSTDGKTGVVYSYDVIPLTERVIYKANGDMLEKFINNFVVKV